MNETTPPVEEPSTRLLDASLQAPGLTEADIEKVRGLIGTWLRRDVHAPAIYEPNPCTTSVAGRITASATTIRSGATPNTPSARAGRG